jgi:hypothetical protein
LNPAEVGQPSSLKCNTLVRDGAVTLFGAQLNPYLAALSSETSQVAFLAQQVERQHGGRSVWQ